MFNKLLNSIDDMNASPTMKSSASLSPFKSSVNLVNNIGLATKGKKILPNHSNLHDNISFDTKETDTVEHIDRLMGYYSKLSEHERHYNHSPDLYDYFNRERVSPLQKYSKKVRHLDISADNPYKHCNFLFI
jgi:hypothetical protein